MGEPTIEISGPDAEDAGRELQALLRDAFGAEGTPITSQETEASGRKVDATHLAIAAFIFGLPGAIRNTIDLAEKMKLVARIERVLAWAKARGKAGTRIALIAGARAPVDLTRAEPADVIDALPEAERDVDASAKK
jgi:hypothetical protein